MSETKHIPRVSCVIPTHNRFEKLSRLVESILKSSYAPDHIELIIIDDASEGSILQKIVERYGQNPTIKILHNETNQMVAKTRNIGLRHAKADYIFFVDDDVIVAPDAIGKLVDFMGKNSDFGIAGPLICAHDDPEKIWAAGVRLNLWAVYSTFIFKGKDRREIEGDVILCDGMPTAFMARRSVVKKQGGFNYRYFPIAYEELDFCYRSRLLGYQVGVVPSSIVWHDLPRGDKFGTPESLYYGAKNSIIAFQLWSQNPFQSFTSKMITPVLYSSYFLLKIFFNRKKFIAAGKAVIRGCWDGFSAARGVIPYRVMKRRGKSLAFRE